MQGKPLRDIFGLSVPQVCRSQNTQLVLISSLQLHMYKRYHSHVCIYYLHTQHIHSLHTFNIRRKDAVQIKIDFHQLSTISVPYLVQVLLGKEVENIISKSIAYTNMIFQNEILQYTIRNQNPFNQCLFQGSQCVKFPPKILRFPL